VVTLAEPGTWAYSPLVGTPWRVGSRGNHFCLLHCGYSFISSNKKKTKTHQSIGPTYKANLKYFVAISTNEHKSMAWYGMFLSKIPLNPIHPTKPILWSDKLTKARTAFLEEVIIIAESLILAAQLVSLINSVLLW